MTFISFLEPMWSCKALRLVEKKWIVCWNIFSLLRASIIFLSISSLMLMLKNKDTSTQHSRPFQHLVVLPVAITGINEHCRGKIHQQATIVNPKVAWVDSSGPRCKLVYFAKCKFFCRTIYFFQVQASPSTISVVTFKKIHWQKLVNDIPGVNFILPYHCNLWL